MRQLAVLFCLGVLNAVLAQAPAKPTAQTLDAIIAVEDANARITALQQFLKANPNNDKTLIAREALVASYGQLGENHLNENSIEKAVDAFQRAIKALPKQVSDRFFRETVSLMPLAVAARGYLAEAIGLARSLETRFASEAERLAAIGEFYATFDAAGEATRALESASKLAPEDARIYRALGAAYRKGLRIDDAVASYQLAVRYDPKDRRAFYDLADLYRSQGAYEDALKLYRRQLEIEPKHTPSLKGIALALTALGRDDEAAASLNQARDLAGSIKEITDDQLLQTQLAFYYLAQNKLREAQRAADYALIVEPRYSWARIVAAEILLAQGKYFEAERHLIEAQKLSSFPTLSFTLGKVYLIVEDFDGAAEQFTKAFRYSTKTQFTTRLGGIRDVQGEDLRDLLAPEHQAAIFLAEAPTSDEVFRIAASLVRVNTKLSEAEPKNDQLGQLESAVKTFVEAESSRRSFRALFMAQKLAQAGRALPLAIKLAEQALDMAEVATEPNGSVRDYPNYDRAGRFHVFRGRAYDARGWSLFKSGRIKDSLIALSQAVVEYGNLPEAKRALWHLATAHEAAGAPTQALELYLAAYEPPDAKSKLDIQRTVIETLYRKVNNSLDGLEAKLAQPVSAATMTDLATTALQAPALPKQEVVAQNSEPAPAPIEIKAESVPAETKAAPKSSNSITGLTLKRETETKPVATKPVATAKSATVAPEKEPVRLGLFGIPVNGTAKGAANNKTTVQIPTNKPAPVPTNEVAAVTTPKSEPKTAEKAAQKTDVTPAPVAPLVVQENPKPATPGNPAGATTTTTPPQTETVATTAPKSEENRPETKPAETKPAEEKTADLTSKEFVTAKAEEKPPAPVVEEPKPSASKAEPPVESKPAEVTITTTAQTVTVTPATPIAPIEAATETNKPGNTETTPAPEKGAPPIVETPKPKPVVLPELSNFALTGRLVTITPSLPAPTAASLGLADFDEIPAPPAALTIPKPGLSPSAAATQANTEPTVSVRYDDLPAKVGAKSSAPAGDSGHALTAPVLTTSGSSRPRRVATPTAPAAPVGPVGKEAPTGNTRPRRAKVAPSKP